MNPDEVVRALRICAGGHCTEQDKENTCPWSCGDETCLTEQQNDAATRIEQLARENAELKEAINRYCHNDCYRDACTGNEDVGIPDCALAKHSPPPIPQPPEKG